MSDYRTYITQTGFALERDAKLNNTFVDHAVLVVGDGILPDSLSPAAQTDLLHQIREYPITLEKDDSDANVWIARVEIPVSDGGFTINEVGIKTTSGDLYAYSRQAGDYKPLLGEGQGKSYTIRLKFMPGNAETIQLKIDSTALFAKPKDLADSVAEVKQYSDGQIALAIEDHLLASDPHPFYRNASNLNSGTVALSHLPVGSGKGLDADKLDGQEGAYYRNANNLNAGTVPLARLPAELLTNQNLDLVGSIHYFATTNTPLGFIKANGATISRAGYSRLFAKIGTTFGSGNGSTTFRIPDLRGEFIRSWDNGRGVDPGRALGSFQSDQANSISQINTGGGSSLGTSNVPDDGGWSSPRATGRSTPYTVAIRARKYGHETRPRNIALAAYIKY